MTQPQAGSASEAETPLARGDNHLLDREVKCRYG
jgi:hypothetical protein